MDMSSRKSYRGETTIILVQPIKPAKQWKKPWKDFVKLNWDASLDSKGCRMGMGIVARNHAGSVLATYCDTRPHIRDPTSVEALAMWQTVEFCVKMGWGKIILEGDALEIIQHL
jgi:hypothetical protein